MANVKVRRERYQPEIETIMKNDREPKTETNAGDEANCPQLPCSTKVEFDAKKALERLREYVKTYDNQHSWESYTEEMWIADILYGLGLSIDDDKYRWATGFAEFKNKLKERHLNS